MRKLFILVLVVAALAGASFFWLSSSGRDEILDGSPQEAFKFGPHEESPVASVTADQEVSPFVETTSRDRDERRMLGFAWKERNPPILLNPPYADQYNELRDAAVSGDGRASYALYLIGERCKHAHDNSADLEAASQHAYQTLMIRRPGQTDALIAERDKVDEYVEDLLIRPYENCRGISREMKEMRGEWLKKASEANHTRAMVKYGQNVENSEESMQILTSAWEMGEAFALPYLSNRYEEAYEAHGFPHDKKMAYASFRVFYDLELALRSGQPSAHTANLKVRLEELADKLLPVELEEAGKLVDELKENKNCCLQI